MNIPGVDIRTAWRLAATLLVIIVVGAGCGAPQGGDAAVEAGADAVYDPLERGRQTFTTYCQGCHGPEGRGDGPVAPMLSIELSDLGLLVQKYGEFPEELVRGTIDGRAEVEGHGTREMPVWGNIWSDPADPVAEERIHQQIAELVQFLESLQRETP